ncbi:MAG: glycosyl transferase family 2 [Acidobacteriaceae bacterium]|nr:glycosyl transferase family 2 [Acidobacteriaceae bacterium]
METDAQCPLSESRFGVSKTIRPRMESLSSFEPHPSAIPSLQMPAPISILILTRNEEHDLPDALASVAWSDDIHVFDSFSSDSTVTIAREAGAHIHQRTFDDYATHRNASLRLDFKHPWLLILDADERPTPELSREMQQLALAAPPELSGFRLRRRDFLFGTWLQHAQISPFYIRLVRPERSKYTRAINEVIEVEGPIGELSYPLDHFPFSKGIAHWVAKHNVYSSMEAELIHRQQGLQNPSIKTALRDPDFHTRRLHQKALFYRLPGRSLIKWLYMMFVRRAVLDGAAGLTYATLQSFYEYLIVIKTKELQRGGA